MTQDWFQGLNGTVTHRKHGSLISEYHVQQMMNEDENNDATRQNRQERVFMPPLGFGKSKLAL